MVYRTPGILHTVVPQFDNEEIYRTNLYYKELNYHADFNTSSENDYPISDFDEHEEQLEFLMDNLNESKVLASDSDFEHFLLLPPDSQSCVKLNFRRIITKPQVTVKHGKKVSSMNMVINTMNLSAKLQRKHERKPLINQA